MEEVSKESSSDSEADCPTTLRGEGLLGDTLRGESSELAPYSGEFQRKETLYDTMKGSQRHSSSTSLVGKSSWMNLIRRSSKSVDASAVNSYTAKEIAH